MFQYMQRKSSFRRIVLKLNSEPTCMWWERRILTTCNEITWIIMRAYFNPTPCVTNSKHHIDFPNDTKNQIVHIKHIFYNTFIAQRLNPEPTLSKVCNLVSRPMGSFLGSFLQRFWLADGCGWTVVLRDWLSWFGSLVFWACEASVEPQDLEHTRPTSTYKQPPWEGDCGGLKCSTVIWLMCGIEYAITYTGTRHCISLQIIPLSGACVDFNSLNAWPVVLLYYSYSFSPIQTFQQLAANLEFSITILSGWRTTITLGWGYCMSFHSSYGRLESTFSCFPWTKQCRI